MSTLDEALSLAARGFRIFPLTPLGKKPAIDQFPLLATCDETTIRAWFSPVHGARVDYNVGISTTGFVVVDIDTKKGAYALTNYQAVGGHFDTFVVQTASGGYHCYFTGPDSALGVNIVPGVDIRSHHGYVVAPGAVTSSAHEDCVDGTYVLVNDRPLAPLPVAIEILLKPPTKRVRKDDIERDKASAIANATMWLHTAEPAVEGQGGNNATYRICAKLIRDFALTEETAFQLLMHHWNHRCLPPWSPEELWLLVDHADSYGKGDLGTALPEAQLGILPVIQAPQIMSAAAQGLYMGNAPDLDKITPRPWKVEKLLMNGNVTILGGMGAAGKSVFQIMAAAHFALGLDLGPFKLRIPGMPLRTILYNAEDDTMEQAIRLSAICAAFNFDYYQVRKNLMFMDDRAGELMLVTATRDSLAAYEPSVKFIIESALDQKADITMFDPLVSMHSCDENSNKHMSFLVRTIRGISRATNTGNLNAHHTTKGSISKEKDDADVFRGASSLITSARIGIIMSKITKEDVTTFHLQDRASYARLDNAKANMFKQTGKAIAWLKWEDVRSASILDTVGVPRIVDLGKNFDDNVQRVGEMFIDAIISKNTSVISIEDAAKLLQANDILYAMYSPTVAKSIVTNMFLTPVKIKNATLQVVKDGSKALICLS